MNYKEAEGIDENGNPTTFKIEIPSAKEQLKQIENSYRELKGKVNNDPYIHLYEMLRFKAVEKELDEGEKAKNLLEIISKKGIHCGYLKSTKDLEEYNSHVPWREELNQEEYDLLKEAML